MSFHLFMSKSFTISFNMVGPWLKSQQEAPVTQQTEPVLDYRKRNFGVQKDVQCESKITTSYSGRLFQGWRTHLGRPPLTQGPGTAVLTNPPRCSRCPAYIQILFICYFLWSLKRHIRLVKLQLQAPFSFGLSTTSECPFSGDEGRTLHP